MKFTLPTLPYEAAALAPVISENTMNFHYGKHLQTYVNNLNGLVAEGEFADKTLEEIILSAPEGGLLNNAGQVFNHTFYFHQFAPQPAAKRPVGALLTAVERDFGSFEELQKQLTDAAVSLFGSGWAWLSADADGKLAIGRYANAETPLREGRKPVLCIDVWEHAYYLDYQNRRADHVAALFDIIDWSKRMAEPAKQRKQHYRNTL